MIPKVPSKQAEEVSCDSIDVWAFTPQLIPSTYAVYGGEILVLLVDPKGLSCEDLVDISEDKVSIPSSCFNGSLLKCLPKAREEWLNKPNLVNPMSVEPSLRSSKDGAHPLGHAWPSFLPLPFSWPLPFWLCWGLGSDFLCHCQFISFFYRGLTKWWFGLWIFELSWRRRSKHCNSTQSKLTIKSLGRGMREKRLS